MVSVTMVTITMVTVTMVTVTMVTVAMVTVAMILTSMLTLTENICPLLLLAHSILVLGPNSKQVKLLLTRSLDPVKGYCR